MLKKRIIPCLDVKNGRVVKGINFVDLKDFSPGKQITIEVVHADGSKDLIKANHSYNSQQIEWFKEGSALNLIKKIAYYYLTRLNHQ